MAGIDRAAIVWSIAIVAFGVAIAGAGSSFDTTPSTAPVTSTPTVTQETPIDAIQGVNADRAESGIIASIQDPGLGHESHQLAILLPPSENTYSGTLNYDATEPIQLVALRGPIGPNDFAALTWTPDGDTIFELIFVDPKTSKGVWEFSGNALALHTMNTNQFTAKFSVDYTIEEAMEDEVMTEEEAMIEEEEALEMMEELIIQGANADFVMSGTIASIQDPGVGHESHQLAILITPTETVYSGKLTYDASEPIQLVALNGPIGPNEYAALTWTPDGDTIFKLTFVDKGKSKGTWEFSGNALALHTMNTNQFTSDFTIEITGESAMKVSMKDTVTASSPTVEVAPEMAGPQTVTVSLPSGSAVPGCEESDSCYIPSAVNINAGDTVSWSNDDTAAHTVTGGSPAFGPDGNFDSSLFMAGTTFDVTFDNSGSYDYFCMVHPWMVGTVNVN